MDAPRLDGDGFSLVGVVPADAAEWLAGEDDEQRVAFEAPHAATLDDVTRAIRRWNDGWREEGSVRHWGIRTPDGSLAGGVELRGLGGWRTANLSYVVFPGFRRSGLATGASRVAVRYGVAHLGVELVRIKTLQSNVASHGVARALGARYVGTEPSDAGSTFDVFFVTANAALVG